MIIIQALLDVRDAEVVEYPSPTIEGSIKAFASIMFAFAGASTFPTIQADMKHKDQFKYSAIIACTSKPFPMLLKKVQKGPWITYLRNVFCSKVSESCTIVCDLKSF